MKITEIIVESGDSRTEEFQGVHMKLRQDDWEVIVSALDDWGREMGSVVMHKGDDNELDPQDLLVQDRFRGQGIAKAMYDYLKSKGFKIIKSHDVTRIQDQGKESGEHFWQKNRGEETVWEELTLPKNQWTLLMSDEDKAEAGPELVELVRNAYSTTDKGSMIQGLRDVVPSDWEVIDWDQDPDIDACIFYRKPRGHEQWVGYKIQGIGHDGTTQSKRKAVEHVAQLLQKPGVWIESSDALRHVLNKLHAPAVTGHDFLRRLFNDPNLKMLDERTYIRTLHDGSKIRETVFGHPRLK